MGNSGDTGAPSDAQLLQRWRAGDRRAGNQLVRQYHIAIANFFRNAVSDDERQDLVQETFARLVTAKDTFRGDANVRSFIFGVARKVLLDHLRKRYRSSKRFDPLTHTVEDVEGATPSQVVAELRKSHRLLVCIRALPVDTKQLLELYYWEGLTADELGRVFADPDHPTPVPPGTIRRRIHDAKKKLRSCLDAEPADSEQSDDSLDDDLQALGKLLAMGPTHKPST